ncbi:unnamed protein product [Vitrella brassicaformis CCMP3155]|uniref:CCT-theta n=2 Tax=Vitrella brassicaformis TaxID=1169539 RepID=A0A0G4EZ61_VITBC|nr:unnamed protein product [Vitrella brassicaformis CCMP3155]|mmetsp:Transcript_13670/g.32548  ORF Transcript_13670/g.32548 Transcript_13670/m.32548 type:complete len:546 (+) Transcript_13670:88-1725(+)|eukprot:CEM04277.1 unnamed protein product [Vitrella brassicaformis CCMP3155]
MFSSPQGLAALLKEGGRHFTGIDEATLKNIQACQSLATITKTSLGPNSMNKLIISHIDKHYVTSDAATMVNELEVVHPAAKLVVMASKMQEEEYGDGTNLTVVMAGELLIMAENLLKQGLHTSDVIKGYEMAIKKALQILEGCVCWSVKDPTIVEELRKGVRTSLSSKQLGIEDQLAQLVAEAAVKAMPRSVSDFNVDNIRVCKLQGGSLSDSHVISGMVHGRDATGSVKHKQGELKVCVLSCGIEFTGTETKGTVLLHNAEELLNFTKKEEQKMEETIRAVRDAGVEVIVSGGNISDIAQHFCNKYDILTVKVQSKFELRRLCRTLGAAAMVRLGAPLPDELGTAEYVSVEEIGSSKVTVIRASGSRVATIVLRGATPNVLDEVERAIDDAVNCVRSITRDRRFVPGAGATEVEIAHQLQQFGATVSGLDQYAVLKFGEALEAVPRILSDNAGQDATNVLTALYAAHQEGRKNTGVNVEGGAGSGAEATIDAVEHGIFDHHDTKAWAMKLATDAAITVLRVDQIIMAKPAGGPKPGEQGPPDEE